MESTFYQGNRSRLYGSLPDGSLCVLFAGEAIRKSADAFYPFHANRNFVYLTGIGESNARGFVLMAQKSGDTATETLFISPPDPMAERWNGKRLTVEEARSLSGIKEVRFIDQFHAAFHKCADSGKYRHLFLVFDNISPLDAAGLEYCFADRARQAYPYLQTGNLLPFLRKQRTIKQPCEIDAMRRSMAITGEAVADMMRASRPGMYEYEYKAVFDAALTRHGVISPGFQPILSTGGNNFYIHYDQYGGQTRDGDFFLCDVGACWDFLGNDVSRGFPVNGKFSREQALLYDCAYKTSERLFGIIRPGMVMGEVDLTVRRVCYEHLRDIGLADEYEAVGTYIWHGGAHHVGFDTHDVVDAVHLLEPGMVFCVDVGIYCEEWGIGFRLEDNCLVTDTGCENLSASIPRSIDEIEKVMNE